MTTSECGKKVILKRQHCIENEGGKSPTLGRVGHAINDAIQRFITIAEIIATDHPEIQSDMYDGCKNANDAAKSIKLLCDISSVDNKNYSKLLPNLCDESAITTAAKTLLSSITRILLLVDIVVVKQLLSTKNRINKSFHNLESIINFTEFVQAYVAFGKEMVELSYLIGNKSNDMKEGRRRAQIFYAQQILERSITLLLTSSKTTLTHYDCMIAKENRDTVFCQIRKAMDLIHFVVKNCVFNTTWLSCDVSTTYYKDIDKGTVYSILKQFFFLMEKLRCITRYSEKTTYSNKCDCVNSANMNPLENGWTNETIKKSFLRLDAGRDRNLFAGDTYIHKTANSSKSNETIVSLRAEIIEKLMIVFEKLLEKTYDFTDCAYTGHENRENILILCDRCKIELKEHLNTLFMNDECEKAHLLNLDIDKVLKAVKNLFQYLIISVADQMEDFYHDLRTSVDLISNVQLCALKQKTEYFQERSNQFHDYCDHIIEVCKLLRHIALTETLQVQINYLATNLRIYGPQLITAAKILFNYPTSITANENFDAFANMWKWLVKEIINAAKEIFESTNSLLKPNLEEEKIVTKPTATTNSIETSITEPEQIKNNYQNFENENEITNSDSYKENWKDDLNSNNDILKRAKNMSAMAFSMYQFTKGNGNLRTTQDLFTQAEYFAEEANRLYKVLRQFSYQVPASDNKKDLLSALDTVPTFVQTLQFTVKDYTVGKAATFVKVEHVIQETKNLMSVINKVVTKCFECAEKYKLDLTGLSGGIIPGALHGVDSSASGVIDSKGTASSSEGSM